MELRRITVCRDCLSALRRPKTAAASRVAASIQEEWTRRRFISARAHNERVRHARSTQQSPPKQDVKILESLMVAARSAHTVSPRDLNALHSRIFDLTNSALKPEDGKLPEEQRVLYVLEQLQSLARGLIDRHAEDWDNTSIGQNTTATSALLGSVNTRSYPAFITKASVLNLISEKAEELARHPTVFITPAVLKAYVELQTLLYQPSSFPVVFDLYARKPIAQRTSDGIRYTEVLPDKINASIDAKTANMALDAAINAHNLHLAIDIINATFCTPAYKKSKILRQALVPIGGLGVAPLAAYTLSTQFSSLQNTMDPQYATGIAFAGIMTYVGAVSMMGYVTITTANDQMDRVTWAQGVPLWERWVREDERAALDKVAGKWGFQSVEKRGEEEGEDWESLKEFVGLRGMVLDRVELMDGME